MTTRAECLEQWYQENRALYSPDCLEFSLQSFEPGDPLGGKASIGVATEKVLANITIWNRGFMDVFGLEILSNKDFSIREGELRADQDVHSLLSDYMEQILQRHQAKADSLRE